MTGQLPHGGRLIAARRRFAAAPEPFLDLSTGINPRPYKLPDWPEACFTRLPEPEMEQALRAAAAGYYGVSHDGLVVAAPGTQLLISLLPHLFPAATVGVLAPTYGEYLAVWGSSAEPVATPEELDRFAIGVVCNPNNPDGRVVPPSVLLARAGRLAARGGMLVVDEAFADFAPGVSLAPFLPHPGLLLLRSFGKAFGLAGLRLGFALADPAAVMRLRQALGPWAVSGPALLVGTQALADAAWIAGAATQCTAAAARLGALLSGAGLEVIGGTPLFCLARSARAARLADGLGAAGILVRTFAAQPDWLRFGLPATESAWQRLSAALQAPTA